MPYANLKERMAEEAARIGILLAELAEQAKHTPISEHVATQLQQVVRLSVLFTPASMEHHWGIPAAHTASACAGQTHKLCKR